MRAEGMPKGDFETNRTGFTVLHPAGLAGCPVSITHSDGSVEASAFPTLIDPWQPFMDIVAMTHRANGLKVSCAFEGDTFETEDQRQWGDASYKTYVRPLALPWPYILKSEEPVSQSVSIHWSEAVSKAREPLDANSPDKMIFPETAIMINPQDVDRLLVHPEDLAQVSPQRLLCHLDTTTGRIPEQIGEFARLQKAMPTLIFDLELVCGFIQTPDAELSQIRSILDASGFKPVSVMVCPSVTFFPELNRKRPPVEMLNFVSHGLCPIVHAADDLSVMETLETIPHITRTARSIIGQAEYRIGPSTIAMRHNPYGNRTIPNPKLDRVCMADDDPRHRAAFGAAYAIGLACALAPSGIKVWTPSELYGPRGLNGPMCAALSVLAGLAGEPVHEAKIENGLATLIVGQKQITANLIGKSQTALSPYEYNVTHTKN